MVNACNPSVRVSNGFQISVRENCTPCYFWIICARFLSRGQYKKQIACPDHHLDVPEVWTKQFSKGTNIGSNNLHPSLDFGDGVLMPKLAKKNEFDIPENVGWTKMET
jgi:hypothetical protein